MAKTRRIKGEIYQVLNAPEAEKLEKWKKEYNKKDAKCALIEVVDHDEKRIYQAYLKPMDLDTYRYASALLDKDPVGSNQAIIRGLWLAGDPEMKDNPHLLHSSSPALSGIMKPLESELKNF